MVRFMLCSAVRSCLRPAQPGVSCCQLQVQPVEPNTEADIPLDNGPGDRGYQSDDSHDVPDAGSDDEGEDLQEDAARCCLILCLTSKVLYTVSVKIKVAA